MKDMKKYAASLMVMGLAVVLPASSGFAAFTSINKQTRTAVATLTGAGTVTLTAQVKLMTTNANDTNVNWTGVTLPTTWVGARNYIQLDTLITTAGGVQTYTDNMAALASPKFTGNPAITPPAGLVDSSTGTKVLPMAWAIKDTLVPGTTGPIAADPTNVADPNSFQWHFYEDASQVAIPSSNVAAFVNADPFITVKNQNGIHFGQAPSEFGAAASPDFLYFQALFAAAVTPNTYQTNQLIVEAFSL